MRIKPMTPKISEIIPLYKVPKNGFIFMRGNNTKIVDYVKEMYDSTFCLCPLGFSLWSPRCNFNKFFFKHLFSLNFITKF